jgi:hypothetical protein
VDNLWLVAPLYPGQELLVSRTETAIHKLLPPTSSDLVGDAALVQLLQERKGDPGCALGEHTCKNVIDDYLHSLGLKKLVMVKGGQEEPNYSYQVTTIDLITGETHSAQGQGPVLEKALLAALVKVAPLASSLSVISDPPGADLFIDTEKVGKTPFDGQILPGERAIKISAPGYKELAKTITVGARGEIKLNEKLELLPSKLTVQVIPKDAQVFIDHESKGQGDQTVDIVPGPHTVSAKKTDMEDEERTVNVEPNKTAVVVVEMHPTIESAILGKTNYFYLGYEQDQLGKAHGLYKVNATSIEKIDPSKGGTNPNVSALTMTDSQASLHGITGEYGLQRGHLGLMAAGLSYLSSSGNINIFPDKTNGFLFDNGTSSQPASLSLWDLHVAQPQVQYVVWHFMFQVQVGFGLRVAELATPNFVDAAQVKHSTGYWDFSPYVGGKANIRGYLYEGLYAQVSGQLRYMFTGSMPDWTFSGGLGYAF